MFRAKYFYNSETLRFEKVKSTFSENLKKGGIILLGLGVLVIGARLLLDEKLDSPKVKYFTKRNTELREAYQVLNTDLAKAEQVLSEIGLRDDQLYRSVFDLDPIPSSVREAGFGGTDEYSAELYSRNSEFVYSTAQKLDQLSTKARIQSVSLSGLYRKAKEQRELLRRKPSIQPISPADKFWLTSTFGYRWDPFTRARRMHQGIDLAGEKGLNIYASGDGVVVVAEYNHHGYGKEIVIDHGFGYESIYAHLDDILVEKGQKIKRGELIGKLGSTGRSTGPHLHYEVRKNSRAVNPMYYFFEDLTPEEYNEIIALTNP